MSRWRYRRGLVLCWRLECSIVVARLSAASCDWFTLYIANIANSLAPILLLWCLLSLAYTFYSSSYLVPNGQNPIYINSTLYHTESLRLKFISLACTHWAYHSSQTSQPYVYTAGGNWKRPLYLGGSLCTHFDHQRTVHSKTSCSHAVFRWKVIKTGLINVG